MLRLLIGLTLLVTLHSSLSACTPKKPLPADQCEAQHPEDPDAAEQCRVIREK